MSEIERELESELHRVLDPVSSQAIPDRRAYTRRGAARAVLGGAGAAVTFKLVSGVAVAAAAVTVAGAAATGSPNPLVWGQQVSNYVAACKDTLDDGRHGIGDCVSAMASGHGQAVASDARNHGSGNGNGNGADNAHGNNPNANEHAKDKKPSKPTPAPRSGDREPSDPSTHPQVTPPTAR